MPLGNGMALGSVLLWRRCGWRRRRLPRREIGTAGGASAVRLEQRDNSPRRRLLCSRPTILVESVWVGAIAKQHPNEREALRAAVFLLGALMASALVLWKVRRRGGLRLPRLPRLLCGSESVRRNFPRISRGALMASLLACASSGAGGA